MNINWYSIKFLPNNKFVKYVAIWLFILPLLNKLPFFKLPFNLYCLFFAALCFAIANIIYMLRCPNIIKDHISFVGFISDGKTSYHLQEYKNEIKNIHTIITNNENNNENLLRNNFWSLHRRAKFSRKCCLNLCAFFYFLGFLCIVGAIGYQTYTVILSMLEKKLWW